MLELAGTHPATLDLRLHRHAAPHAHPFPASDRLLYDALIVNLCSVAALTWLVFDSILCFPEEVRLVWGRWHERKGRHSRRIYLIVRYASILNLGWFFAVNASTNLSPNLYAFLAHTCLAFLTLVWRSCNAWPYIVVITTTVATLLPDVMLLIRINAVYGWRAPYLLSTGILFFIQLITSLGIGFVYVSTFTPVSLRNLDLPTPGCLITAPTLPATFTLAAWIPSVVAQCVYLTLVLRPFLSVTCSLDAKGRLSLAALRSVRTLIPTMDIFAIHGVIYTTLALGVKIATAALVLSKSGPLQAVGIPWLVALYPILATRIYLTMVAHLHFPRNAPLLPTPSGPRSVGSIRLSYASVLASPRISPSDSGPITFASRASLSHTSLSRLDYFDDEF